MSEGLGKPIQVVTMPGTTQEYQNARGLPKVTRSICPECGKMIDAEYYEKDGKVYAKKTCPEHGE